MIPGKPCTVDAFKEWFAGYINRHGVTLIEEDTWQHSRFPGITGYEFWEAKKNDTVLE